jgi:hypothetical protein
MNVTVQLLYLLEEKPRLPLNRRLGGLQSWFGHFGEEKDSFLLPEFKLQIVTHTA